MHPFMQYSLIYVIESNLLLLFVARYFFSRFNFWVFTYLIVDLIFRGKEKLDLDDKGKIVPFSVKF